jgi:hypothetical protein
MTDCEGVDMGNAIPPMQRFMALVTKTADGHWMWNGHGVGTKSTRPRFRHTIRAKDPQAYAHRWIYEQMVGPIPDGYEVDHVCKVGMCVNPDHLEAVTPEENQRRERLAVCKNGHTQTDENSMFDKQGRRRGCKICDRDRAREYYRNKVRASGRTPQERV